MKKALSFVLVLTMCLCFLPLGALAEEEIAEVPAEPVEAFEEVVPTPEPEPENVPEPEPEPEIAPAVEPVPEPEPEEAPAEEPVEEPAEEPDAAPALDGETNFVDSGDCGYDLTWTLTEDGVLTISGTGAMFDFSYKVDAQPWFNNRVSITSVVIGEGVTTIGPSAFQQCYNLKSVTLPDSLKSIMNRAFAECSGLSEITIPAGVTSMRGSVFSGCSSLESIYFLGSAPGIGDSTFIGITATAYYPTGSASWTDAVKKNYGGNITWKEWETPSTDNPWVKESGGWRYYYEDGTYAKDRFIDIGDATYYIDASGYLYLGTGWLITDRYYYFKSGARATGLQYISGNYSYYYFLDDGTVFAGWMKYNGAMYFFKYPTSFGRLAVGLTYIMPGELEFIDGTTRTSLDTEAGWYYFDTSTAQMYTGILKYNGSYYLFKENGALYSGWLDYDGARYYYDTTTYKLAVGWKKIEAGEYSFLNGNDVTKKFVKGGWYYFDTSTAQMYAGGTYTIGSKSYKFDENGRCIG